MRLPVRANASKRYVEISMNPDFACTSSPAAFLSNVSLYLFKKFWMLI